MISSSYIFKSVRHKLVSALLSNDTEVRPAFSGKAKKRQIVIDSPNIELTSPTYNSKFDGEQIVNLVISVYGSVPEDKDELGDFTKMVLSEDNIDYLSLIAITDIDNTEIANNSKYHSKSITFTYLVESGDINEGSS